MVSTSTDIINLPWKVIRDTKNIQYWFENTSYKVVVTNLNLKLHFSVCDMLKNKARLYDPWHSYITCVSRLELTIFEIYWKSAVHNLYSMLSDKPYQILCVISSICVVFLLSLEINTLSSWRKEPKKESDLNYIPWWRQGKLSAPFRSRLRAQFRTSAHCPLLQTTSNTTAVQGVHNTQQLPAICRRTFPCI